MDAFSIAAELIPGIELTADQLAQLRAVNHRYYSRLFALSRTPDPDAPRTEAGAPAGGRQPTAREAGELRAMLVAEVRALLTPEQRRSIEGGG